ncbi:MAG: hypothetical protein IT270_06780 [Saprospiraceae bacterium]|nr:hypothetical protein [Saprospiraceae bacterium]
MFKHFAFLAAIAFFNASCASWQQNRWLADHHNKLKQVASSKMSPEQKTDALIQDYIVFMNEGLQFADPTKGAKYVKKYHDQNDALIEQILRDTKQWQGKLNTSDKIALGIRTAQKPYLKDLIELGPKFKRKYQQYAFVVKMTDKVLDILNFLK